MSYQKRLSLLFILDSFIVLTSVYISYWFIRPGLLQDVPSTLVLSSLILLISHHIFAYIYKLYVKAWEYASIMELINIFKAVSFSVIVTASVQWIIDGDIYVRVLAITWMAHMLLIGGSRFAWRVVRDQYLLTGKGKKRVLIVGAGSAGTMVARQLLRNQDSELCPVAFVDDDPKKQRLEIFNIPIAGTIHEIESIVKEYTIHKIIIAIPSLKRSEISTIFEQCIKTNVKTQIIPLLEDLIEGKVSVNQLRDVQVEDLLGRESVRLDDKGISGTVTGKTILVTGAGGSIGSEICRQVIKYKPKKIVLLGHGENSIYHIEMELLNCFKNKVELLTEIADIQDRDKIFSIIEHHQPTIVYHAAAHKHVPLMERNPEEAIKNNIIGTKNVVEASDTFGVDTFVMVSTDKAVNPTNVMGATKRVAEMIVQHYASISKTKFVAVRFGNVLGSRGSVIPLFKKQIQSGGPITVTHPEITRYFMTIPEASRLVIQAGALAKGEEIFVLDMGEPVKIVDLAKNLIVLSGYSLDDIEIKFTGLRPGEKMYEELLNENEVQQEQVFPKIHIGKTTGIEFGVIQSFIHRFEEMEKNEIRETLLSYANKSEVEKSVV
ncbi:nucleoside-diphosphate sugar epimerase/dehydratase [Bacillus carboniphilus]|uniref:Nucleoside-diphosphate sugar epimerase/dehydratase n=1 Tax=Bacillus carboniphilus TaxID=86663 RepID=A0ABY9JQH6_9BACI|nr:nucleoside-diphosphate sugar epimerase/dehydratase [Bacillus carboniphilus]WLR41577.1 nucleoside-diphosphate sugar epimerase/dehydratase [Bacillus carboniphilus]